MKPNQFTYFLLLVILLVSRSILACDPIVNLGSIISFCQGNSIALNATNPNSTYLWNTGATTPTLTVSSSGTYWVAVTNNCGTTHDTVQIIVDQPLNLNLGVHQEVCIGSSYIIQPPYSASHTYLWQDGTTGSSYHVITSGMYSVEVTNGCGTFSDSIQIDFVNLPNLNLGPDLVICNTNAVTISAGNVGYPIKWSTGQTTNSISFNFTATFWAESTNVCGKITDTISVYYSKPPNLGGDTIGLCLGGTLVLDTKMNYGAFLWNTGATTSSIVASQPGTYWVTHTDVCGVFSDTVEVIFTGPAIVDLGLDTTVCAGSEIELDAGYPGSNHWWYQKDASQQFVLIGSNQKIKIDTGGVFVVAVNNGCGQRYDTISVELLEVPFNTLGDTVGVCQGTPRSVDAGYWGQDATYLWDDGATTRTHFFSFPGAHSVRVTNQCGTYLTNFYIRYDSYYTIDLGPNDTICADTLTLAVTKFTQTESFLWSTGSDKPFTVINSTGTYWVRMTNQCGIYTDTIEVVFLNTPKVSFGDDISLCFGNPLTLTLAQAPGTRHLWNTGDTTSTLQITQAGTYWATSYNYCDTVSDTINISLANPITFSLGPDITICEPNITFFDVSGLEADSIRWNTGSKNGTLVVTQSGTYIVELFNVCGIFSDTVVVTVNPFPKKLLKNTAYCIGGNVLLDATQGHPNHTFLWNNSFTTPSIIASTPGWYWVEITNDCGTIIDSVFVREDNPILQIDLGNDTVFCSGTMVLDPGFIDGATYEWQNGFTSQKYVVAQSGQYYVKVQNSCNTVTDTINVLITGPPHRVLGTIVNFCFGHQFILDAENPGCTYRWSTGETTQQIIIDSAGVYSVEIKNNCGTIRDSVEVMVEYPLEFNLGNDTIICTGDQLLLDPGHPGVERKWNTGSIGPSYIVFQTGKYWVDLINTCGIYTDTIYVEVQGDPVFSLGADTVICGINGQLDLVGPSGMRQYLWNDGQQTQTGRFTQAGKYWLTVSNHCFSYTDTILVEPEYPIDMNIGPDTIVCETETYILNPGVTNYPVFWDNNTVAPTRLVIKSGWYWAMAVNSCGSFIDSAYIQVDTIIDPIKIDTLLCREDSVTLDLSDYLYDFEWFDGSKERIRTFKEEGIFPITIYNECGVFEREFEIVLSNCDCPFYIANTFTPNSDGLNDEFKVVHDCPIEEYSIEIFSRWGTSVFYSEDPNETWDGTFKGKELPVEVYTYKVYYKWKVYSLDRRKTRFGYINLIR